MERYGIKRTVYIHWLYTSILCTIYHIPHTIVGSLCHKDPIICSLYSIWYELFSKLYILHVQKTESTHLRARSPSVVLSLLEVRQVADDLLSDARGTTVKCGVPLKGPLSRAPKDRINRSILLYRIQNSIQYLVFGAWCMNINQRILRSIVSGIPLCTGGPTRRHKHKDPTTHYLKYPFSIGP